MKTISLYGELIKVICFSAFTVLGCAYFIYAATQGPFGLYEKGRVEADEIMLKARHDILVAKRIEAENRTKRLSDTFLDLDLLDEQARKVLGYARTDEIILR
jgi:cell division protein FtsB